ncbi:MAG: DUF4914 family protein, partial [Mycobacterium sp.]
MRFRQRAGFNSGDRDGARRDRPRTDARGHAVRIPARRGLPFKAGGPTYGDPSLAIVPVNAAFFTLTLMDLQGWCTFEEIGPYTPRSIMYVAPPFRHTYFHGRQAVVHQRTTELHEVFAYNLYPGPSAKK